MTFTARQLELVEMIAEGFTDKEISKKLHLSIHTVKQCNTIMFKNVGAKNRAHVVTIAFRAGLIK